MCGAAGINAEMQTTTADQTGNNVNKRNQWKHSIFIYAEISISSANDVFETVSDNKL